jgi:hypothetical protein
MADEMKAKAALALGAVLSLPVARGVRDGSIPIASGAIRIAIAMALAYAAILIVTSVIHGYLPRPVEPRPPVARHGPHSIEDAVLVDDHPPADGPS